MSSIEKEVLLLIISKKLTSTFTFRPRNDALFEDLYKCACDECAKFNQSEDILDDCYFHINEMDNTISILQKKEHNSFDEDNIDNYNYLHYEENYELMHYEERKPAIPFEEHALFAGGLFSNYSYV